MSEKPVPPPTFATLEPEEEKGKFELIQGLAEMLVAVLGVSLALFAVFAVGRAIAPPVRHPVAVNPAVAGVKPDSVYAGSPAPVPSPVSVDAHSGDNIIYFAPTTATLPVLVSSVEPAFPAGKSSETCQGTVPMLITISAQGLPTKPAFRQPPDCGMENPALKAVMNWRFRPAELDGKALPVGALVEVHFR